MPVSVRKVNRASKVPTYALQPRRTKAFVAKLPGD